MSLAGPADITEKIEAAGGIVCITTAMRGHPTDCDLQCSACRDLNNIAGSVVVAAEVIECLIFAMQSHQDDSDLQDCVCCALRAIAAQVDNVVNIEVVAGIEWITAAMQSYQNQREL